MEVFKPQSQLDSNRLITETNQLCSSQECKTSSISSGTFTQTSRYQSQIYTPFHDEYHFLTFESISAINILQQFGSIIIVNNTFTDNIGTVGGAINIDNMVFLDEQTQTSLVIKKNKFLRNMAYFSGNAFQVSLRLRMTKAKTDAEQMCGAAILIEDNLFQHNIGTKQHSGGAGLIQCFIHEKQNLSNSGIQLSPTNKNLTDPLSYTGLDYDKPYNTTRNVTDLYDSKIQYPVLKYGTQIRNNKFVQNFAGIQGTALKLQNINELQVMGNVFQENGPVTSLQEKLYSPYFNILVNKTMTITFSNTSATCINEYAYYHQCNERGYHTIDQPVQGALYIFSCHQENTCFGSTSDSFLFQKEKNKEQLQQFEDWHKRPFPYQNTTVSNNFFNNNQANLILSENHQIKQASSIFIKGGKNVLINKNQFVSHSGLIAQSIKKFAYDLYSYFGQDFFEAATAPIIVVEYSFSEIQSSLLPNTTNPYNLFKIEFSSNQFKYNSHYQSLIIPSNIYQGALIVYDSNITTSQINFSQNYVGFNKMLGPNGALIHIKGGIMNATSNLFEKNGYISTDIFENHPQTMHFEFKKSYISWKPFSFQISQDMGLFFFEFKEKSIPVDRSHWIENNTFTQSFCISGCVYSMGGAFFQQFTFINNRYSFIVSSQGVGAVTSTSRLAIARQCPYGQLFVQTYLGETFQNIYGGAIYVTEKLGQHVKIMKDSVFYNNFGDEGAAISITDGGILLITNTTFMMDPAYVNGFRLQNLTDITSQILHTGEDDPALTKIYNLIAELNQDNEREIESHEKDVILQNDVLLPKISKLMENFTSFAFPIQQFISQSVLKNLEMIKNDHGQIRFDSPIEQLKNYDQPLVGENGMSLRDFCINLFGYDPVTTRQSVIKDSQFHNLFGHNYSAISIFAGQLLIFETKSSNVSFTGNVALTGSPIFADKAHFELLDIRMINNYGHQGGCISIGRSEVFISRSLFQSNMAYNGGVIFIQSQSKVLIDQSKFLDNLAYQASVMLCVDNKRAQSIKLQNSVIRSNYSYMNLFSLQLTSMKVTSCEFTNNFAFFVNHGFSILLNSKLQVNSSLIQFTDGVKLNKLFDQQMYGFFFVMLQSKLTLSDQTQIQNIQWGFNAAISIQSQSSLYIQNGVNLFANSGYALKASTIDLINAQDVSISNTNFQRNSQDDIVFTNTKLLVRNSTFNQGQGSFLSGLQSSLYMMNTTFFNSSDLDAQGHALSCDYCSNLLIDRCLFYNLTAESGSALRFMESVNVSVINSIFARNQATDFGGAIYLIKPTNTKIQNCTFIDNSAASQQNVNADKKFSAGAIFYECKQPMLGKCDVELLNNNFTNNTAIYAGGAIRAVNQNFTVQHQNTKRFLSDAIIDTNTYSNNSAFYGNNFASRPESLQFSIYDPQNDDSNLNMTTRHLHIAPGQSFQLKVSIHDTEGRLYSIAHGIEGHIELVSAESLHPNSLIQANKVISNYGVFNFDNLNIQIPTESQALVVFKVLDLETFTNPVSFIESPINITVYARNCHSGESYSEVLACVPCVEPFYSYQIINSIKECKSCPDEAYCYGRNYTAPKKGYWRSSPRSDIFMKCKNQEACLAGNKDNPLGICQNGYQGILCAECTHENYKIDEFICANCAKKASTIVFHILFGIALVAIISLLVRSALKGRGRLNLGQCFAKIIVNHYQMLIILSIIEFKLPEKVKDIIAFQNKIASIPLRTFSLDCLLMQTIIGKNSKVRLNYALSALFCSLPYAFAIISVLFWQIVGRTCRKSVPRQLLISQQWATFYIVTLLFYPMLTRVVIEGFNCIHIEEVPRLYKDLTQICWTAGHLRAVKWMYAPTLVIWLIGFPIVTFIMIFRDKAQLNKQLTENPVLTEEQRKSITQIFEVKWGFLLSGFTERHFYWEVVMMLQKTLLVVLTVLFSPLSASLQALLMVLVLAVFLTLQIMYQPFVDQKLNDIQKFSILVLIGVIYIGLYYLQKDPIFKDENPYIKWMAFIFILAPTLIFLAIFMFTVRLEVKKALKSIPILAQILSLKKRKEFVDAGYESESRASEQQGSQETQPDLLVTKFVEPTGLRTIQIHGNLYSDSESSQLNQLQSESSESFRESEESQSLPQKSDTTADFSEIQFSLKYVASREKEQAIDPNLFLVSQRRQQIVQDPIEEATDEDSIDNINDIDESGANRASSHIQADLSSSHQNSFDLSSKTHFNHASVNQHAGLRSSHIESNKRSSHISVQKFQSNLQINPFANTYISSSFIEKTNSLKTESDIISDRSETSEEIITTTFIPKPNKQDMVSKPVSVKSVLEDVSQNGQTKPAPKQTNSPQMQFHDIISKKQRASLLDSDNGLNNLRKHTESDDNSSSQVSDDEPNKNSYQSNVEQRISVLEDTTIQLYFQSRGRMTADDRGQTQNRLQRMTRNQLENITEGLGTSPSASLQTSDRQQDQAKKRKQPSQIKNETNNNQRMSSSLFVPQGRSWNQTRNQNISSRDLIVQQREFTIESSEEEQKLPAPNVRVLTLGDNFHTQNQETVQRTEKLSSQSEYETQQKPKRRTSVKFQDNSFGIDTSDISFDLL